MGATGFIGRHLCRSLVECEADVVGFALSPPSIGILPSDISERVEWIIGDIADSSLVRRSLEDVDMVYHLVCTTVPSTSNANLLYDLTSNLVPTLNLLEQIRHSSVRRIVFVSSGGTVYGVPITIPIPESHPTNPISGYGIHKLTIEKYLHLHGQQYGLDYRVLRLSNPYGIGQLGHRAQGVIGSFVYRVAHGEPLEVWGDGSVVRDYVHIDDVMSALLAVAHHQGRSRVLNIGSGEGHSIVEIVNAIERVTGTIAEVSYGDSRAVDVPVNVLDVSLARDELGWSATTSLEAGISSLYAYCIGTAREDMTATSGRHN